MAAAAKESQMPKLKTKSGAKKRFKVTASGIVLYQQSRKRHGMIKRTKKQIRQFRGTAVLFNTDDDKIKKYYLPNGLSPTALRRHPSAPHRHRPSDRRSATARVKRGVTGDAKHKKVFTPDKGYYGRRKNTIRVAKQAVEKANEYTYRGRKRRKRTFRALWIQRLNAAVRPFGLTYSRFIGGLGKAGLLVDRKVLSDLAIREPAAFAAIVEKAKAAIAA